MLKFFIYLYILSISLYSLEVKINSDEFNKVSRELSRENNINKLIKEERVPFKQFINNSTDNFNNNLNRREIRREYAKLKMLLVSLSKKTKKSEVKTSLYRSFFKLYSSQKITFNFIYKISYKNTQNLNGDEIYEQLQKKISLYILDKYGISNIEDETLLKNTSIDRIIKNHTLGTIESNYLNNFDNPYQYSKDETIRSGIVSFIFYPFVMEKQNHTLSKKNINNRNSDVVLKFEEIRDVDTSLNTKFILSENDKIRIKSFTSKYTENHATNISLILNQISKRVKKYNQIAMNLFTVYPICQDLDCLDQTITKKLNSFSQLKKKKIYIYNIDLSNDDDLEYVVIPAFRKLKKYLRRDTKLISIENREIIKGDSYSKSTMESKFIAVIQNIIVIPYIKDSGLLGLHFKVNVSFEESNLCSQYLLGKSKDTLYGMEFIQLKFQDKTIEVAQTELTNYIFNNIYPKAKRDKECKKSQGINKPINCLQYTTLSDFLIKINNKSIKYKYRFLTCKEALFLATCGKKQKFCWGNKKEYIKFEFIRSGSYDLSLKNVAEKNANTLNLYDLCGNSVEYCTNKDGWYRTYGSTKTNLKPHIMKNSYSDISTIRLVRETK